jgi:hypothetical protein
MRDPSQSNFRIRRLLGILTIIIGFIYLFGFCIPGAIVLFNYAAWNKSLDSLLYAIGYSMPFAISQFLIFYISYRLIKRSK